VNGTPNGRPDPDLAEALARERDLMRALLSPDPGALGGLDPSIAALVAQPGFGVHRNTAVAGCMDALRAAFPSVAGAVGDTRFAAVAIAFVRAHPPSSPVLVAYGDAFPSFLRARGRDPDGRRLADLASLDALWLAAHVAPDADPLPASAVAALPPQALGALRARPHPAARWASFADGAIVSAWRASRRPDPMPDASAVNDPGPMPEAAPDAESPRAVLIVRPTGAVACLAVPAAVTVLLDACADGATLGDAAQAALSAEPSCDLSASFATLLRVGAFDAATLHTLREDER
jgi:hypothetical protein